MSKKYWSQQETEVLVNQFIHRKVSKLLIVWCNDLEFMIVLFRQFFSALLPQSKPNDGHGRKYTRPFSPSAPSINQRIWLNYGRSGTTF